MKKTLEEEAEEFGRMLHERNTEELRKLGAVLIAKSIVDLALADPASREEAIAACKREHFERLHAKSQELMAQSLAELDAWFRARPEAAALRKRAKKEAN